jgi:hypothetical protein
MPAKKLRRRGSFDLQAAFAAHVEANQRAHEWAAKCLAYREAGQKAHAKAAEKKARHWLRKMMVLEAHAAIGKPPPGGRREES